MRDKIPETWTGSVLIEPAGEPNLGWMRATGRFIGHAPIDELLQAARAAYHGLIERSVEHIPRCEPLAGAEIDHERGRHVSRASFRLVFKPAAQD